jgi:hypothetical protein
MEKTTKEGIKDLKNTVIETSQKVSETINTRIKNPFIFSYLISLIFFNWKPISIFFKSKLNIYQIINSIEKNQYEYDPYKAYLYPLLIALAYTFLLPFIEGFRSLILDLAENLKLYSTSIQIKNFQKKQNLEFEKSDLKQRNSYKNSIITLESKNKDLQNKVEIQTIKNQTSKIEIEGLIKQTNNFEKIQSENKTVIQKLMKDLNESQLLISTYESNIRNVKNSNNKINIENKKLEKDYSLLKSSYQELLKEYKTKEKRININEFDLNKISKQTLKKEYIEFKKSEVFDLFIQFVENKKDFTLFTDEAIEILLSRKLIEQEKYFMSPKVKYRLTDKGIFFLEENYRNK